MRAFIEKYKKVIIIGILIGVGFIPFVSIREAIIDDDDNFHDNLPYEYSPTGEQGYLCVFPSGAIYSNVKIHWLYDLIMDVKLVFMNDENYYKYEKLAYYRVNGDIHINSGNWLALVNSYTVSSGKSIDEGDWYPPYLDWWCMVFVDPNSNHPILPAGMYGYGGSGVRTILNLELSIVISIVYFASIVILFFLNRKYDLKAIYRKNIRKNKSLIDSI